MPRTAHITVEITENDDDTTSLKMQVAELEQRDWALQTFIETIVVAYTDDSCVESLTVDYERIR